ncbi:MAG: hypothetical protein U0942_04310 [Parvibaculum sp.]|uniref:hypothetical protein n=1 Tax=Parvibaculum sp. TaxID=2024848 RepID=UPI002ABC9CBA|nr:hypothetical protein [Parvibaculum sp.]MDZ4380545.1 hypothetical protein [Parvibaculum sp.]
MDKSPEGTGGRPAGRAGGASVPLILLGLMTFAMGQTLLLAGWRVRVASGATAPA